MSTKLNKKKSKQLRMPHGTAANRLRKSIMFDLLRGAGLDWCHQCGKRIMEVGELSIEHKTPWLDSDDPVGLFFDLDNIAFSHLSCNIGARRQTVKKEMTVLQCCTCHAKFERETRQIRSKIVEGQKDFYCSLSCAASAQGKGYGRRG